MTNTALQVTDFDFYGDTLMALRDNATGEVYTAINFILRGIGFTERQIEHVRRKWSTDSVISYGVQNFATPSEGGLQDTYCISIRKLPLALAKINITPKMKEEQPELSSKLELYQDKCADVLASVFIDGENTSYQVNKEMVNALSVFTTTLKSMQQDLSELKEQSSKKKLPEKKYSRWKTNTFKKLYSLQEYVNDNSNEQLTLPSIIHLVIGELKDIYNIEINEYVSTYKCEFDIQEQPYALDVISHYKDIRDMFTLTLNQIFDRLHIPNEEQIKVKNIFDELAEMKNI